MDKGTIWGIVIVVGIIAFFVLRKVVEDKAYERKKAYEKYNIWEIDYYVDDFGHKTENGYIAQKQNDDGKYGYGVFSNSATTRSKMEHITYITANTVAFRFWDYGKYELKNNSSTAALLDFKCLASSGERMDTTVGMQPYSNKVIFAEPNDAVSFIDLLKNNQSIEVVISSGLLKYEFTLSQGNFKDLYEKLN